MLNKCLIVAHKLYVHIHIYRPRCVVFRGQIQGHRTVWHTAQLWWPFGTFYYPDSGQGPRSQRTMIRCVCRVCMCAFNIQQAASRSLRADACGHSERLSSELESNSRNPSAPSTQLLQRRTTTTNKCIYKLKNYIFLF